MGYVPSPHPLFSSFACPQPQSTHVLADSQENHKYFVYGRINDKIGAPSSCVFRDIMEVISYHNTALKDMISKHNAGSVNYFSNKIQNEFIRLLGNQVRAEIIAEIKKAKYFSLLFICTPDVSDHEQISQIIRYVSVSDGNVSIKESFIDFIHAHGKTGNGLASEILNKLTEDGIYIENARGQCYDNAADVAGKYNGVQAHILQKNALARFVPCAAHSLNLTGVHATSVNNAALAYFGTVQRFFTFFSSSTADRKMLMNESQTFLKGHSEIRWTSKASGIKAVYTEIIEVCKVLNDIVENVSAKPELISTAQNLLHQIDFQFLCTLSAWKRILNHIDKVNQALQSKNVTVM
jgi:hypothetical protein